MGSRGKYLTQDSPVGAWLRMVHPDMCSVLRVGIAGCDRYRLCRRVSGSISTNDESEKVFSDRDMAWGRPWLGPLSLVPFV